MSADSNYGNSNPSKSNFQGRASQFSGVYQFLQFYFHFSVLMHTLAKLNVSNTLRVAFNLTRALSTTKMVQIKEGDKVPSVDLFEDSPANKINIADLCANKKVALFAVPGAFTPGCSKTHLPGYIAKEFELKSKGINEIVCVSVNDPFVMGAWATQFNTKGKIRMLADPSANFVKALDLTIELPPLGGVRAKRFSMVIDNGIISELNVEPDGTGLSCSLADRLKL